MATAYKFVWDKGTTIVRSMAWKTNVGTETEPVYEPVDLTGYSARMELRTQYGGELLHRLDTDGGSLVIDGPNGAISFEISASLSATWEWRNAVYDLELVDAAGRVTRLIQGTISLTPEVTTGD